MPTHRRHIERGIWKQNVKRPAPECTRIERSSRNRQRRRCWQISSATRVRQKKWIMKFGAENFREIYKPLYHVHGNKTGKLSFELETEGTLDARLGVAEDSTTVLTQSLRARFDSESRRYIP
ncbi:hypothetical protein DFH09DRAFT_1080435 [Mycena vulgaris]|nr:hypothetical protein DFH09DRAFT_1080435 [Mycena vulgaris]